MAVTRIFKYLKGTKEFGLWYPKGNDLSLFAYTDAYWAGCIDDRRSTSGVAFYLGECLVLWMSKKQSSVTQQKYKYTSRSHSQTHSLTYYIEHLLVN
jgi:hypothetical protein